MTLREYIEFKGTTQEDLARKAGVSHRTLVTALTGKKVSWQVAIKLEKATHRKVKATNICNEQGQKTLAILRKFAIK